jgi:hypothetical protein
MIEAAVFSNDDDDVLDRRFGRKFVDRSIGVGRGLSGGPAAERRQGDGREERDGLPPSSNVRA